MRARIVLTALVATLAAAPNAPAAFPGKNGLIAYDKAKNAVRDIWVMMPNGAKQRDVTMTRRVEEFDTSFSPNGRMLAFVWRDFRGRNGIGVVNADGSRLRHLTTGDANTQFYSDPNWTADGKSILYDKSTGPTLGIFAVGAKSGPERQVLADAFFPRPSPDGRHLAYMHIDTTGTSDNMLVVGDVNGANPSAPFSKYPANDWSPDSTKFTFEGPGNAVFTSAIDGSSLFQVADTPLHDGSPVFSPDGRFVLWINEASANLWIANTNGTGVRQFSHQAGREQNPSWGRAFTKKKRGHHH